MGQNTGTSKNEKKVITNATTKALVAAYLDKISNNNKTTSDQIKTNLSTKVRRNLPELELRKATNKRLELIRIFTGLRRSRSRSRIQGFELWIDFGREETDQEV